MSVAISEHCDFTSSQVKVLGTHMHYIDTGPADGAAVLFLHGNPSSSYLWRNVIPQVARGSRCIAPDLVGYGRSGKPFIAYRFEDHVRHIEAFIEALRLKTVTLVLHEWGAAIGLDWARRHAARVSGIALMEFVAPVKSWVDWPEAMRPLFQALRTPGTGRDLVIGKNALVEQLLPAAMLRRLTKAEMENYRAPFADPGTRQPMLSLSNDLPIAGQPADVLRASAAYMDWLAQAAVPKILFWATPGLLVTPADAARHARNMPNLQSVDIGPGLHFLPEENPALIGRSIASWIAETRA